MNKIRRGALAAGFILLGLGATAAAGSTRVLAVLSKDLPAFKEAVDGFHRTISRRIPGAVVETVILPDNPAEARNLLENVSRNPPDIVLAVGGSAVRQTHEIVRSAAIISCMVRTGETNLSYGTVVADLPLAEYVNQIRRALPGVKNIGFIYDPSASSSLARQAAALEEKGALTAFRAASPADVDRIMTSFRRKADCLLLWPDSNLFPLSTLGFFLKDAFDKGVPVVGVSPSYVKAGAVAAFFADYGNNGELAADMALKALDGHPLEKLGTQTPSKIKASFNIPIARRLNVAIDDNAVASADEVIR